MPERFDPYHQWLGIPPQEQPPDHYRLLAMARFEAGPDVIGHAADQRMAFLRTFQAGPHANDAVRLLNEVARARITLLDPRRKAAYDTMLRSAVPIDAAPAAVAPPPPPVVSPLAPGQTFGRFRLAECIRRAGQATIYRAEDIQTGHPYCVKLLNPEAAADPTLCKRFRREIEITTQLHHPHLVAGYEGGQRHGFHYLVTEYVVGTDLRSLVKQHGPLPVEQAIEYIDQAACGLGQLHLLKVYHRNVAPKNLWVDLQGRLKVTNLFLARIENDSPLEANIEDLTRMGDKMGTVEFLAPEQSTDASSVDQRADIYSLGCTLHFLLTGQPVYPARSSMEKLLAHRTRPIPSLVAQRADVPEWLDRAFQRMVAKSPLERFASMAEVSHTISPGAQRSLWSRLPQLVASIPWPFRRT